MDFAQKNNAVIRLGNADMFEADKKLFDEKRPNSKLHKRLKGANHFNKKDLDEAMIFELLDHVTIDDIENNRTAQKKSEEQTPVPTPPQSGENNPPANGTNTRENSKPGANGNTNQREPGLKANSTKAKSPTRQQKKSAHQRNSSRKSRGKKRTRN